jgi:NAD(P)-dependent dehydrogenase (short-subunit alcohol dehydrogenase family)
MPNLVIAGARNLGGAVADELPAAGWRPILVDLEDGALDARSRERDGRGHTAGAAADDQRAPDHSPMTSLAMANARLVAGTPA